MARGRERGESGRARQARIKREQHTPEQNRGYDEAVRGGPETPNTMRKVEHLISTPPEDRAAVEQHDVDERETRNAIQDVRQRERSEIKNR